MNKLFKLSSLFSVIYFSFSPISHAGVTLVAQEGSCTVVDEWSPGRTYQINEQVTRDGVIYQAKNQTDHEPAEGDDWQISQCDEIKPLVLEESAQTRSLLTEKSTTKSNTYANDQEIDFKGTIRFLPNNYPDAKRMVDFINNGSEEEKLKTLVYLVENYEDVAYGIENVIATLTENATPTTWTGNVTFKAKDGFVFKGDYKEFTLSNPFIQIFDHCEMKTPWGYWKVEPELTRDECITKGMTGPYIWIYWQSDRDLPLINSTIGRCETSTDLQNWSIYPDAKSLFECAKLDSDGEFKEPQSTQRYRWKDVNPVLFVGPNGMGQGYVFNPKEMSILHGYYNQRIVYGASTITVPPGANISLYAGKNYRGDEEKINGSLVPHQLRITHPSSYIINDRGVGMFSGKPVIRVRNEGGYAAYINVEYTTAEGDKKTIRDELDFGWTTQVDIPKGATIDAYNVNLYTGLVWSPIRSIFSASGKDVAQNFCAKIWGTTFSPRYDFQKDCAYFY